MAAMRGPRSPVGSAAWVAEERAFALQVAQSEADEFSYSARNELDWLNEHMAGIFNENEMNLAETFKTPGKLRGKTPHATRRQDALEARVPLSDVFGAKPRGISNLPVQANRPQSPQPHANVARNSPRSVKPSPRKAASPPKSTAPVQDSGYFGSQDVAPLEIHMDQMLEDTEPAHVYDATQAIETVPPNDGASPAVRAAPAVESSQDERNEGMAPNQAAPAEVPGHSVPESPSPEEHRLEVEDVEAASTSPPAAIHPDSKSDETGQNTKDPNAEQASDDAPSDGSSPIRPVVRKSSLNFASLPAREPLTAGKSVGSRASRTSHLDHARTSYYNRHTGGKSLGNLGKVDCEDQVKSDEAAVEDDVQSRNSGEQDSVTANHTKTYTQRLQDQIIMLGNSQSNGAGQPKLLSGKQPSQAMASASPSLVGKPAAQSTPGDVAEEDEDDDWIEPPANLCAVPALPLAHSMDAMDENQSNDTMERYEATGHGQGSSDRSEQPIHALEHTDYESDLPGQMGQTTVDPELLPLKPAVSASQPSLRTVSGTSTDTPSKSPSRSFRESPLKQVKNKLSCILKSSKGLLASSAAVSAEGRSLIMSPSSRPNLPKTASSESVVSKLRLASRETHEQVDRADGSPAKPLARRTRASAEREKEEKRREKEAKRIEAQNEKLEKARVKEREKALVFNREQERIAAMEKQMSSKKAEEKGVPNRETPKPTRSSPRKAKAGEDEHRPAEEDAEMEDVLASAPPASAARPTRPGQAIRAKEAKRPVKPAKEMQSKTKQAPTVIRVNTGSQSQYHSSSRLSTASHDTAGPSGLQPQGRLVSKPSKASLHAKASTQGLKPPSSVSRPKTVDLLAKKRELDEREAQRRRDAKADAERKRAAAQEEQRKQEQWRRQEAERQRQQTFAHSGSQMEGKTAAQRRAALEKAKQTRAPPPAARSQANGPAAATDVHEKIASTASSARGDAQASRPQSRMTSTLHRSHDESSRPVGTLLSSTSKAGKKRALGAERGDESQVSRGLSRGGAPYQANEAKRRRTSETFEDDSNMDHSRNIKGPPVRPSGGYKKDLAPKATYGYANAPHSATRDLFKATVTAQHNSQVKTTHPLDMAQISKGPIPFAPTSNAAGPSHKTPARTGGYNGSKSTAKSGSRSSPRFQNGESIELPEIQTDDEDDDDDDEAHGMSVAAWADSPDLRRALMLQETMDPSQIFGPPAALNMEEVFHKSKDRWHKFRARTSSANWSGADRLTEEDIRKDLAARDKLRREGGWSYEMSREML